MEGGDGGSTWMQGSWEPVSVLADAGFTVLRKPKRVGEKTKLEKDLLVLLGGRRQRRKGGSAISILGKLVSQN